MIRVHVIARERDKNLSMVYRERPMFRIPPGTDKSGRGRLLPVTPDFSAFLDTSTERVGPVFTFPRRSARTGGDAVKQTDRRYRHRQRRPDRHQPTEKPDRPRSPQVIRCPLEPAGHAASAPAPDASRAHRDDDEILRWTGRPARRFCAVGLIFENLSILPIVSCTMCRP
jgi:hypothetical protein